MSMDSANAVQSGLEQGVATPADIDRLQKAIAAGYGGAGKPTDLTYGGVLQAESLETTLKSVTFDMKNLKFWPAVQVDKAHNLFEQYNRITSYGSDASPYIGEGGAAQEEDSTYVRDGQKIVFFATRRKVTHQMTLVRTAIGTGDIVAQQAKEGTMYLLKNIERELYWGNAHFADAQGNFTGSQSDIPSDSIAMNGLLQQIRRGDDDAHQKSGDFEGYGSFESVLRDLGGNSLSQDDIEELSVILLENFSSPDQIHLEPQVLSTFVRQFYPQFRSAPGLAQQTVGYDVNKVQTTAGTMDLKPNLFLRPRAKARATAVNSSSPGLPAAFTSVGGGTGGKIDAGVYEYRLTEVNDFGESSPINTTIAATVTAGQVVTLVPGAAQAGTKYFRIYRSAAGGTAQSAEFIGNYRVGLTSYVDKGARLPGLGEAFMLDMSAECMKFKQLAPLSKLNFAVVTTAIEFGIILYGALFCYTPRFLGVYSNAGK